MSDKIVSATEVEISVFLRIHRVLLPTYFVLDLLVYIFQKYLYCIFSRISNLLDQYDVITIDYLQRQQIIISNNIESIYHNDLPSAWSCGI
jgi:hypothetical protein